jgi:DNA-binding XRE family transcriptional regulator
MKIPKKQQEQPLRVSRPPYTVFLLDGDNPMFTIPGEAWRILERFLAPMSEEVRSILVNLRRELNWSRAMLAAVLGVSRDVVRRWETGQRTPSGAARRLIWLLNQLFFHRGTVPRAVDLIVWGRGAELRELGKAFCEVPG